MCRTKYHRLRFGTPGDWQFKLACGQTAYGWYMKMGIISIAYLRPFTCRLLGHSAARYSLLLDNIGQICARCNRIIDADNY